MSDVPGFPPGGFDPESLRDAPLFRELQRVMAAGGGGPVNWELARQVGVASAAEAGDDRDPTDDDRRQLDEAVRVAELHVARFTGLEPPTDVPRVRPVRRAEWVGANLESLRSLLEPAASRAAAATERALRGQMPPEVAELETTGLETGGLGAGLGGMLGMVGPLLQGTQIGTVLGVLAQQVFGQFDVAVPRSGTDDLLFVVPNIARFERDWSLDPVEFRTFVAVHEVTHRFELARPWARERFGALVDDFLSTVEFDVGDLESRFAALDPSDPEALQQVFGGDDPLLGAVLDDEQRLKLGRVQAFMASAEGYADHVTHALAGELLATSARIEEAMRRYREGEAGDPVFERLLGIEMKKEQYARGRAFCDAVVAAADEAILARMWSSADALPSLPELDEPTLWLSRTV